ncbi:MAG TPA: LamG-like jellyroll fold domain-containing protein, partial [Methylomirabilota bacterium]|nr:LamG-like jellyroll fold domain-containing protein [Methylomirabilota bacterium]
MCKKLFSSFLSICVLTSPFLLRAAEQVTISEFLASNTSGLRDEDNTFPDWIELHNAGLTSVNLDGWFLTDAAGNLTKWRIPATNINAGGYLVIFADGKNRLVPGAPLHTSFSLSAGGEYLALVKPDGTTIASQFAPEYPGQAPNVSYGIGTLTTNITVINSNTLVRVRIPDGTEGASWAATNYNDSAWTLGPNGVGYGTTNSVAADYSATVLPTAPVVYYRLNESSGAAAANTGSSGAGQNGTYNGATLGTAGPRPPAFNGFEPDNNAPTFNGSSGFVAGPSGLLSGRNAFTVGGWIYPTATPAARTGLFGQNDCVEFGFITGTTLECWTPGGGSVTAVPYPFPLNQWHHVVGVANGSNIRIFIDGQLAGTGGGATANYGSSTFNFNVGGGGIQDGTGNFFNGQIDEVVVYHRALSDTEIQGLYRAGTNASGGSAKAFVRTDVGTAMSNINASAYLRIPFTITEPTNVSQLTLRVRHDDGFAAFINGTEVARVNAPASLNFNSAATNTHSPLSVDEFRFGGAMLVPGTNVLAIQGLNVAANDEDFLIAADLIVASALGAGSAPLFFTVPSPGAPNTGGVANPGPAILDLTHSPNVPKDFQDVTVTARITPTFAPISSVVMRYRIMFGSEIETPMFDDGAHGDGAAADGVFGASIPESASTNGQMIRWYIRAVDVLSNTSRWPVFVNQSASAEYLGTIVDPTNVTSKLPIFHLFAPPTVLQPAPPTSQTGADGEGGGRVGIFYDGEFYDNVYMELRGNTSAGQAKKSHRLVFNREHEFRHLPEFPRIRKTSFMAEFLDPAYIRQHLSFWLLEQMGVPSPFFYPVRAQLNGSFYALVFHNDVIDEEQVGRMGYDPAGALYKAVGNALPSETSTGVFEKKSPPPLTDHTDYQTLVRAINETNTVAGRRAAAFDMLDIPQVINYLAGARWNAEND